MEREDRDRRRLEAMHAKRYPIDDLDLIAEQRHRSSYSSGSSSMLAFMLPSVLSGYALRARHHLLMISASLPSNGNQSSYVLGCLSMLAFMLHAVLLGWVLH